ncbi:MarR family winged helix-turn-helix transcriptional regulator [Enterovibrio calviensis]|uniref:MarR family winged helix-turn-helix transcriptional regulator n=1 Tax=Enterovibrio calviensis TaxID=91359 RepID=UPI0004850DAE|nr:MarR family transcriptional regulator [Enterovibrio calviensis]
MVSQYSLWQRVKIVVDRVENQIAKEMQREHGLGLTEYRALKLLSNASDSELRMQELAKLLGLNQSSVTRLVERLEKGGYTIRDLCPKDKRGVYTVLTGRGREVQSQAENDYAIYIKAALDSASQDEENCKVVDCLRQIIEES